MAIITRLILLTGLMSLVTAFTVPEGAAGGVYSAHIDENGVEVHTLIANATELADLEARGGALADAGSESLPRSGDFPQDELTRLVQKRDFFGVYCGGTHNLNAGDTDWANSDLDRQCGDGKAVEPGWAWYSIKEGADVVAFFCNFSPTVKFCYASSRQADSRSITALCGLYQSGWTRVEKGGLTWSYGYDSRRSFCGSFSA